MRKIEIHTQTDRRTKQNLLKNYKFIKWECNNNNAGIAQSANANVTKRDVYFELCEYTFIPSTRINTHKINDKANSVDEQKNKPTNK